MQHFIYSLKTSIPHYLKSSFSRHFSKNDLLTLWPFLLTAILGIWNHFFYAFSGYSAIVALFCPVNESVWEHLKLLFFPFLFVSVLEYPHHRKSLLRFFYCRYIGVVCGILVIVTFFYTYTGITGHDFLIIDILLFFTSTVAAFLSANYFYLKIRSAHTADRTLILTLWITTAFFFFLFTCFPPDLPIFYSP